MFTHRINHFKAFALAACLLLGATVLLAPAVTDASTTTPETVNLAMTKHISGANEGFSPSDFSYLITGNGVNTSVPHGSSIALTFGTYSIEELVPAGFHKSDWRIGWYGECEAGSAYSTTVTIDEGNIDHGTLDCQADNQYRPDNGDNPEYGCTDAAANNYDADATIDDGSCTYDPDPILGCTDVDALNYNASATVDDGSCTYPQGETWLIDGYVWHDVNEDGVIDEGEDRLENWELQITNGSTTHTGQSDEVGYFQFYVPAGTWVLSEVVEEGWQQVFPTPTTYTIVVPDDLEDSEPITLGFPLNLFFNVAHAQAVLTGGPYNFGNVFTGGGGGGGGSSFSCMLSASDTTVRENAQVTLTWNANNADSVDIDNGVGSSTSATGTVDVVVSSDTTYTLTATRGNDTTTCSVTITTESKNGGGGGCSNCGGGGSNNDDDDSSGGSSGGSADNDDPIPQVLGEQVSVAPAGAPNAGAGGTAANTTKSIAAFFVLAAIGYGFRRIYTAVA